MVNTNNPKHSINLDITKRNHHKIGGNRQSSGQVVDQGPKSIPMTQAPETLGIMDGTTPTTAYVTKRGIHISRGLAFILIVIFLGSLIVTGVLVYVFTRCQSSASTSSSLQHSQDFVNCTTSPSVTMFSSTEPLYPTWDGFTTTQSYLSSTDASSETKESRLDHRLPRSIVPHSYDIKLIPFIYEGNFTFHGDISIVLNVTEVTNNITLHSENLTINYVNVYRVSRDSKQNSDFNIKIPNFEVTNDTARQFVIIKLVENLVAGQQCIVRMKFTGVLNDVLMGFYRSSYVVDGQKRWIAATQFQPTDARRAFPCFDEPNLKARFKISIGRPKNMTSISNMPRRGKSEPIDNLLGYEWDHFENSLPMSTYLVAFCVTDFGHIENDAKNFSVWTRQDALSQARYSLKIGPKILKYFEQYFHIRYPLPKMDMIALPDFAAGAMENWGIITYRETALLYQEDVSTSYNQQRIATVVSHELAHQWFGNLVTPSWWTDLWLNEGFASYVEYIGVDAVQPRWKILDQFIVHELHVVFSLDALESSHQISVEVGHPDEINEIFDRISYAKGASIIRMMDHFLTTDIFKKGLTNYLNSRKYSCAEQNDLWEALTIEAHNQNVLDENVSIKDIMDTWTLQTGYPVVTVERNYEANTMELTQERFLLLGNSSSSQNPTWWIPITYTSKNNLDFVTTKPKYWMKANQKRLTINELNVGEKDWVLLNVKETGYYRVNYDQRNWRLLTEQLLDPKQYNIIDAANRAQLINDAMNLARAGKLNYDLALNVTRYLEHERDYVPWKAAFVAFDFMESMLVKSGSYDKFKSYVLALIDGLYQDTGFKDDPQDEQLTVFKRVEVLHWACSFSQIDCTRQSVIQFQNWMVLPDPDKNNPISPNLKNVVYCAAIRVGGQPEWDFAWKRYLKSNVGSEREILMNALGCTRETWILSRYLEWSLTEGSGIRKQDTPRVFASVASNVIGQQLAFNVLRNEWSRIRKYLGSSMSTINNIVKATTKKMNTAFELKDLKDFAKEHHDELGQAFRSVEQSIENAESNIQWMMNNYKVIVNWLESVVPS